MAFVLDDSQVERMQQNLATLRENVSLLERHVRARQQSRAGAKAPIVPVPLSARELQILALIADGQDNAQIAERMHFGLGTIKLHVRGILEKMHVSTRTEAAVRAVREGLI